MSKRSSPDQRQVARGRCACADQTRGTAAYSRTVIERTTVPQHNHLRTIRRFWRCTRMASTYLLLAFDGGAQRAHPAGIFHTGSTSRRISRMLEWRVVEDAGWSSTIATANALYALINNALRSAACARENKTRGNCEDWGHTRLYVRRSKNPNFCDKKESADNFFVRGLGVPSSFGDSCIIIRCPTVPRGEGRTPSVLRSTAASCAR